MEELVIQELKKPLDASKVKTRSAGSATLSYVEGWYVIDEANRIFGHNNWTRETIDLIENTQPTKNTKGNFVVSFRAKVKVTACGVVREGVGFGSGINSDIHSAYEGAIKEAETDAMKRALMTFGYPLGLALYDKDRANVEEVIIKINEIQKKSLETMMDDAQVDKDAFLKAYDIVKLEDMPKDKFLDARAKIEEKKRRLEFIKAKQLTENKDANAEIPTA
jgi:DNA recombination protein Rad52